MFNYDVYERLMNSKEIYLERIENDQEVYFRIEQRTDSGANVLIITSFYKGKDFVDIEIYNFAKLTSPLKEEKYLALINELNGSNRYAKYYITPQQDVRIFHSYFTTGEFTTTTAEDIFHLSVLLLRSADESYSKFMKLQWA